MGMKEQKELRVRDIVRLSNLPYADATVVKIESHLIHLVRPYLHTADFEYTGGVIPYVGLERMTLMVSDTKINVIRTGKA